MLFRSHQGKMKPGAYTLNTSMTAAEMIEVMAKDSEEESGSKEDEK